jgi:trimeric autotransporter adhesin
MEKNNIRILKEDFIKSMKNTLLKVWGIVLTLAILSGLLMATVPVAGAELAWTAVTSPAVTQATSANVLAIAPDGTTWYVYTGDTTAPAGKLYKSTNAGVAWTSTGLGVGLNGKAIMKIEINPTTPAELIATDGLGAYRSSDAGANWYSVFAAATADVDTAINANAGVSYMVAGGAAIQVYNTNTGIWTTPAGIPGTVRAASFSPNFANDGAVFAVVDTGTELIFGGFIVGYNWNVDIASTPLAANGGLKYSGAPAVTFAFPDGFSVGSSSSGKVFVSVNGAGTNGVYRVNTRNQNAGATLNSTVTDLQIGAVNPYSIAYKGNISTGTLAVGLANDMTIWTISSIGTATSNFNWISATKNPRGLSNAKVIFSPTSTTLYVGTAGAGGSAISSSTDYLSYNGFTFISVSAWANTSIPPAGGMRGTGTVNQFQTLKDNGFAPAKWLLFKSTDSAATWKLIYEIQNLTAPSVNPSPAFATDGTIYLAFPPNANAGFAGTNKITKSVDGGNNWDTFTAVASIVPNAFTAVDGTNYWVGSPAGVRASNSATTVYLDGGTPSAIIILPGFFLVWEGSGAWFISTDGGQTFIDTGSAAAIGFTTKFTFVNDGTNWNLYLIDAIGNIQVWTNKVSTAWSIYCPVGSFDAAMQGKITSLGRTSNGVWYFVASNNAGGQLWRCTKADLSKSVAADYEKVPGMETTFGVTNSSLTAIVDSSGYNQLYIAVNLAVASTTSYSSGWYNFGDTIIKAPATTAPVADSIQNNTQVTALGTNTLVDLVWAPVSKATSYDYQIAYDKDFTNVAVNASTTSTTVAQIGLVPGKTYYWRVRVSKASPLFSLWSAGVKFGTAVVSSTSQGLDEPGRIYPANGGIVTGTTMTFTWGSVSSADSYDFKLLKDGTEVSSKTGLTDTYFAATGLTAGSQYTWQVRAISAGVAGKWVTSAFSVAAAAGPAGTTAAPPAITVTAPAPNVTVTAPPAVVPTATYTINVPPSTNASTGTPAWAWIVIVIGAVLVIAVIVLIVRTRRV